MTTALPTNHDENWRYANLRPLAKARPEAVDGAAPIAPSLPSPLPGFQRWVFIDGRHDAGASTITDSIAALLSAKEAGAAFQTALDGALEAEGVDFALARINAQRGDQVLQIRLPDDAGSAAVELLFLASTPAANGSSYPRVQVQAGRNSKLSLVERHASLGDGDALVNSSIDLALSSGAVVDHVRVQQLDARASVYDTLTAHVAQGATYRLRSMALGALASRSTMFVKLAGRGARCDLVVGAVANGIESHDLFAEIDHAAPETATREVFRGIANERGKLAFNGKMIVRQQAHGADSDQSLKSLLTGSGAEAAARPQLEIYTDKVRARHGATTGKLDEQMLFYLLSRGVDRTTAQALLQWAFIEDAVRQVDPPELRREIESIVAARLRAGAPLDGLLGERA